MTTPPALRGLELVEHMQWGQRYVGWELSELTGLKPRTLRNYFTQLKAAGSCIRSTPGADGNYWLDPGSTMYPLRFTNEEARTIAIALDEVHWLGKKRKLDLIKIRVMYAAGAGTGGRR